MSTSSPPLTSLFVLELAGLAPAPFAGLLLADFGATVLRIDRPSPPPAKSTSSSASSGSAPSPASPPDLLTRHKSSLPLNLKRPQSLALLRSLLRKADVLIDPYRPGVLESLGLSTPSLQRVNPRLIIARLSGYRRDDTQWSKAAGHDINYLAVSGVLSQLAGGGADGKVPTPPGNLVADFAGGGAMCVLGILLALLQRERTGKGQVVEANMVDGAAYLGTFMRLGRKVPGLWDGRRGENLLDGGVPWYGVFECKGGDYMAVGALEDNFWMNVVKGLNLGDQWVKGRRKKEKWVELRRLMEERFLGKTREEWESIFSGTDACCTPVLEQSELENRGYQQRPAVHLTDSPAYDIPKEEERAGRALKPGKGAEAVLKTCMGWDHGREYDFDEDGNAQINRSKL